MEISDDKIRVLLNDEKAETNINKQGKPLYVWQIQRFDE